MRGSFAPRDENFIAGIHFKRHTLVGESIPRGEASLRTPVKSMEWEYQYNGSALRSPTEKCLLIGNGSAVFRNAIFMAGIHFKRHTLVGESIPRGEASLRTPVKSMEWEYQYYGSALPEGRLRTALPYGKMLIFICADKKSCPEGQLF